MILVPAGARPSQAHIVGGATELDLVGFATPFGFDGTQEYTDVWGEGRYAYLGSAAAGVAIIDLATPATQLEHVQTYAPAGEEFQDVKVRDGIGYFSGSHGTHIVDLTDPLAPVKIGQIDDRAGGHAAVRNVAIGNGLLYQVSTTSPEIRVIDVADPSAPQFLRSVTTAETVGLFDVTLEGERLFVAGLGGGSTLFDVSHVAAQPPVPISQIPSGENSAHLGPAGENLLIVSHRELGGSLAAWDISDLGAPHLVQDANASDFAFNSFSTSEVAVLDSTIAFVAWYEAGLQVIDLDELTTAGMQRIGLFNTSPDSNPLDGFVGARSVFPFLGADRVLISDTKWGLYVVDATEVLPPSSIAGDYDQNRIVDLRDYNSWKARYGTAIEAADGNGDGLVEAADYVFWRDAATSLPNGRGVTDIRPASPVPEPGTCHVGLLAVAWIACAGHIRNTGEIRSCNIDII